MTPVPETSTICQAEVATCLRVLKGLREAASAIPCREEIERLVAVVYKRVRKERRRQSESRRIQADRATIEATERVQCENRGLAAQPAQPNEVPEFTQLKARSRTCYVCKQSYRQVHRFYHFLCAACASTNFSKRQQSVDMSGRQTLVTGGRIKIGYQTALKLLRWGASVTVTTRFPADAICRYRSEADFESWQNRLSICEADFRDVPGVVELIERLKDQLPALDVLVNNAAQSVRKSAESIEHLRQIEADANPLRLLDVCQSTVALQAHDPFPGAAKIELSGLAVDRHGEVLDLREKHGWTHRLAEVDPLELLEVLLINANAPCLLTSGLLPLFRRSGFPDRYVINVTGLDGQFNRQKNVRHPHVNMSKAALNMMTRTSAREYACHGVFMNSVDTGWITHEGSHTRRMQFKARGFVTPLDEVDGAARILDPVVCGLNGDRVSGKLFRHYQTSTW